MPSTRGQISAGRFFRWYFGTLVLGIVLAFAVEQLFHLHPLRGGLLYCGLLFVAGAADRPKSLFQMMRNVRWFGLIESDQAVRSWMWVLGLVMLVAAAILPNTGSW